MKKVIKVVVLVVAFMVLFSVCAFAEKDFVLNPFSGVYTLPSIFSQEEDAYATVDRIEDGENGDVVVMEYVDAEGNIVFANEEKRWFNMPVKEGDKLPVTVVKGHCESSPMRGYVWFKGFTNDGREKWWVLPEGAVENYEDATIVLFENGTLSSGWQDTMNDPEYELEVSDDFLLYVK